MEEGQRRAADPVVARRPGPPRLRHLETHRSPLRRRAALSRYLTLPTALPSRRARLDPRTLGRKIRTAKTPLLPPNRGGTQGLNATAAELAGICGSSRTNYGN